MTFSIRPHCRPRTTPTPCVMSCRPQRGRTIASFKRLLLKWTNEFQIYLTSPREKRATEPGHLVQMALGLVIEQVIATKLMQELTNTQSWRTRRHPKLRRSSWYPPPHPPQSNVRILHPSTLPHANVVCHSRASLACSGSRKRVPLPPQRDSFQEGSRGRADVGYRSPPSATRDSVPASRLITNDARIPSGPRLSPLEISRDTRSSDARGSRQAHSSSALHSNSQTDTYAHNESRDKRGQDQMDVEDPPAIIAKSTEPSRQLVNSQRYREDRDGAAPKRPRAMMDDVEVPARRRSPGRHLHRFIHLREVNRTQIALPNYRVLNGKTLIAQHMKMSPELRPRGMKGVRLLNHRLGFRLVPFRYPLLSF